MSENKPKVVVTHRVHDEVLHLLEQTLHFFTAHTLARLRPGARLPG
ncbi:hypothetical protein KDH_72760 [Dictyobacter sp. S3.2.2.5]|uniref:Uncharacterized protein n=1 Tax=Dictyobacter halimunensis TaxID=3026934 RepID=A0ABQ6G2W7_9CHLR|nr:hypothetical protein KDH_72760 [Dictyobacter sp. S3.2.2.5]